MYYSNFVFIILSIYIFFPQRLMAIDISDDNMVDGGPEGVHPHVLVSTFLLLSSI